mgnify:CR=1 FL=1
MKKLFPTGLPLLAGLSLAPFGALAVAGATCYDFSGQEVGTAWLIEPKTAVPIDIGTLHVRPLVIDGIVQTPAVARFEVVDTAIAGGVLPELAGTAVAVQLVPDRVVHRIRLRYSHQPGADDARGATIEVNGSRRDWRGAFERLNHESIGRAGLPARFTVTPLPAPGGGLWRSGQMVVESREAIRSFTIGAAVLRLDDICLGP